MLKTILIFLTLSIITTTLLAADVFKCNSDGKFIYQQSPCTAGGGQHMDIQINNAEGKGLRESEQRALESIYQHERMETILNQQQTREEQGRSFKETEKTVSSGLGAKCTVSFEPHDNTIVDAGVGLAVPGTNLVNVPTYSATERCAQILIQCTDFGSVIVEPKSLVAYFADGKKRAGGGGFKSFRLHSGESKTVFTCFGPQKSPIVRIEGEF